MIKQHQFEIIVGVGIAFCVIVTLLALAFASPAGKLNYFGGLLFGLLVPLLFRR